MALTPEDIETHTFKLARRGYDKVEVDRFLGQVAAGYRDLQRGSTATAPDPAAPPPLPQRVPGATGAGTDTGELFALEATQPAEGPSASGDDFNRLGSEVANVLRSAHHSVAALRHEAEVEAAVIRQRADREIADLRREADEYAARVKAEADLYATDRANEANYSRREAERVLAEAQAKADANLADTERRIAAITERAEAIAYARTEEIMADAHRRIDAAKGTEAALREQLIAAHGDLAAALKRFPAEHEPTVDITDEAIATGSPVVDLTGGGLAAPTTGTDSGDRVGPIVPDGWPGGGDVAHLGDLSGEGRPGGGTATATVDRPTDVATEAEADAGPEAAATEPGTDEAPEDPLPGIVKDAIGKAVQRAMNHSDSLED